MIFGRPTNLLLGAFTAIFNVVVLVLASQGTPLSVELVGAVNIAAAAIITLIAGQPPTLKEGDTITVVTPGPSPNTQRTV